MQCPKNNLNLRIKTEPVTDSTVYDWLLFYISIPQHPDIYRCIHACSNRDRLIFYVENKIILGQCGMEYLKLYVYI